MLCIATILFTFESASQNFLPGQAAKFGIDGDVRSDVRQNGSFQASGSHDWFKKHSGTGQGLIDTSGAAALKEKIKRGQNISFSKRMAFAPYSVQDGILMMDGLYSRDYNSSDYTSFSSSSTKNTASPSDWGTSPDGSMVSDKTDIIDTYVSMRRNGTTISGNNPSDLIVTMALTTLATGGDHYVDFEFYKERISYNSQTGIFENSGPAATGGHSVWEFNNDGSLKAWGDMTISYSFNSTNISEISILIWVAQSTYNNINPKTFDFLPNSYHASTTVNGYGYARIEPNGGGHITAWGTVSTATAEGPEWGTNSKDLGSANTGYYSENYSSGQFAEAAANLTKLGIDPALTSTFNECNSPFTRFIAKSRSSSSFSSSLSDFVGPFSFLDAPSIPATMVDPGPINCASSTARIEPAHYVKGGYYTWRTDNGHIVSYGNDNAYITTDKPGTYYLTSALSAGCLTTTDSLVIGLDHYLPVAKATSPVKTMLPNTTVTLSGGDLIASNYATPYGQSSGLSWRWDCISGGVFSSTLQNPQITQPGSYRLVVTEKRNGCTDTAVVTLGYGAPLPVTFTALGVRRNEGDNANLVNWRMDDIAEIKQFAVEKSTNATDFRVAGYVFPGPGLLTYTFKDPETGTVRYYRIKAETIDGNSKYSPVVKAINAAATKSLRAFLDASDVITLSYHSDVVETVTVSMINMKGELVFNGQQPVAAGSNTIRLPEVSRPAAGIYIIRVQGKNNESRTKLSIW
jgi:hypothetical protein